uniref:Neuroendocrine protein 7B2 n=1 Tax=Evadne anonyx TaxID=141404 RepID=A0A9N6ZE92_9CRUS|nr:EOG090X0DEG [Evadne anonyx]
MRRSLQSTGFLYALWSLVAMATAFHSHQDAVLTDAYLRGIMNRFGDKMADVTDGYLDYALPSYDDVLNPEMLEDVEKEYEDVERVRMDPVEFHSGLSIRDQEFLKHSSLFSHQKQSENDEKMEEKSTAAAAAEKDSTSAASTTSAKGDNVLPAYCNPPNPCPIDHSKENGCLEEFENTAAFSREFQSAQDCMCDTEHMFDCPASSMKSATGKNRANVATVNLVDTAIRKVMSDFQHDYNREVMGMKKRVENAVPMGVKPQSISDNPYLQGEKLPIAAKKGFGAV